MTPDMERKVIVTTPDTAPEVQGRRTFLPYRDLRAAEATGGKMRANLMRSVENMMEQTGWHYHTSDVNFGYVRSGWIDLTFEDGQQVRLKAGDSIAIPGGVRHNETALSNDFQVMEIAVPAEFETVPCDPPPGMSA